MRFSRKSPAVGSMKRHCPEEDLIDAPVNARVAVLSRGFDSAAAEGLRTTPARETAMTDGLAVVAVVAGAAGAEVVMMGADDTDETTATAVETGETVTLSLTAASVVVAAGPSPKTVDVTTEVTTEVTVEGAEQATGALAAGALVAGTLAAGALAAGALAALPPKVNDWLGSAELQAATSMTAPLTVKQLPAAFSGVKARGPAPPEKENNCEFVTRPPEKDTSASLHLMAMYGTHLRQLDHHMRIEAPGCLRHDGDRS